MASATFEELRTRHTADRDAALPGYLSQLQYSAAQLRAERERRMRILLATAKARSPWHRERLRDVDAATFTEGDVPSVRRVCPSTASRPACQVGPAHPAPW